MRRWAGLVALIALPALAQPVVKSAAEQKEMLVRRLLTDSPVVQRIEASGNAEAVDYFRRARELHERSLALIASAQAERAEADLNEAMWLVGKARQLVPDPMRRAIELRVQNRAMTLAIDSLRASYVRNLARNLGVDPATNPVDDTLKSINARLDEATEHANAEQVERAHTALRGIERDLMAALGRVLGTRTIDYTQRFSTQAEEFQFELARNRGYQELLPVARSELYGGRDAAGAMAAYAARNAALVERAQKSAAKQEYGPALEALRQGTGQLQNALAAAGLVVPRDPATPGGQP